MLTRCKMRGDFDIVYLTERETEKRGVGDGAVGNLRGLGRARLRWLARSK